MKKLSKKDALRLYYKHWDWCAKTGGMKEDCPPEAIEGIDIKKIYCACFLCEYHVTHKGYYCQKNCLIVWPNGVCVYLKEIYTMWRSAETPKERKKWAAKVRDLPARK